MQRIKKVNWEKIPVVTAALVFANILFFINTEARGSSLDTDHIIHMGAMYEPLLIGQKEYYRLVTSFFLHFGLMHLVNNMFSLLVLGASLEHAIGSGWFGFIYFASGICSSLVSMGYYMYTGQNVVSCGASGAIYGLMGALLVLLVVNNRHNLGKQLPRFVLYIALSFLASQQIVTDRAGQQTLIDNSAHIGGFAGGVVICIVMCIIKRLATERNG